MNKNFDAISGKVFITPPARKFTAKNSAVFSMPAIAAIYKKQYCTANMTTVCHIKKNIKKFYD